MFVCIVQESASVDRYQTVKLRVAQDHGIGVQLGRVPITTGVI
jgi:hypothetical protein